MKIRKSTFTNYKYFYENFCVTYIFKSNFTSPSSYTLFGIGYRQFSRNQFEWYFSLFGIEFRLWIRSEFVNKKGEENGQD